MYYERKNTKSDLRKFYTVFLEIGLIIVLICFIAAVKIELRTGEVEINLIDEQEMVEMEDIIQTEQIEKPPPPPRPPVPVEVPNDEVIEDEVLDLNFELNLDERIELPPPPEQEDEVENFFIVVEQMPSLIGGLSSLQNCIDYPLAARRAGIEGTVVVQFIVNEQGNVEDPRIIRSQGGGTDEEALRCVRLAKFEPGRQRGTAVRVQYSVPVIFRLTQ